MLATMQEDPKMAAILDELSEIATQRGKPDLSGVHTPEAARRWVRAVCGVSEVRQVLPEEVRQLGLPLAPACK